MTVLLLATLFKVEVMVARALTFDVEQCFQVARMEEMICQFKGDVEKKNARSTCDLRQTQ